jgi:hypothetical protein
MAEDTSFVAQIRPVVISLANSSTEFDATEYWRLVEGRPIDRGVTARYELADHTQHTFDIAAIYEFLMGDLRGLNTPAEKGVTPLNTPVRVTCKFVGHFHVDREFTRDEAQVFIDVNAWVIFWPFFRQFVSDATARMSIPPEILPLGIGPGRYALGRTAELPERRQIKKKKAAKRRKA